MKRWKQHTVTALTHSQIRSTKCTATRPECGTFRFREAYTGRTRDETRWRLTCERPATIVDRVSGCGDRRGVRVAPAQPLHALVGSGKRDVHQSSFPRFGCGPALARTTSARDRTSRPSAPDTTISASPKSAWRCALFPRSRRRRRGWGMPSRVHPRQTWSDRQHSCSSRRPGSLRAAGGACCLLRRVHGRRPPPLTTPPPRLTAPCRACSARDASGTP